MTLNELQVEMCETSTWDFSDLTALFLNCTLKRSPELSHTQGLIDMSRAIMEKNGVSVEVLRPVDYNIAYGVYPDMTEQGWEQDDWPQIYEKVKAAEILVLGSAIWLGEKTSVCTKTIERLYASSGDLNESGQYAYYGKVGGCLITGNDDGAKHCAMNILYSLQHLDLRMDSLSSVSTPRSCISVLIFMMRQMKSAWLGMIRTSELSGQSTRPCSQKRTVAHRSCVISRTPCLGSGYSSLPCSRLSQHRRDLQYKAAPQ